MTLTFYAVAPEKDFRSIRFFFKHLKAFKRCKEQILANKKAYAARIAGTGVSGLYFGEIRACLGELMTLYEGPWKFKKDGDTHYLVHMTGSPLSGGNSGSFWSVKKRKIVHYGLQSFGEGFHPLMQTKEEKRKFTLKDDEISAELADLLRTLADLRDDFAAKQKKAAEQRKAAERLERIVDPAPDKNGVNALMRYCQTGDVEKVRLVWKHSREQFDAKTKDGLTPVNFAAKQLRVLQFLCRRGETGSDVSPVAAACEIKDDVEKRLNLLFKAGADINAKNDAGEPPLVVAAEAFNVKAVRWLLKHGADKSATNANGETAKDIVLKNKDIFDWKNVPELL